MALFVRTNAHFVNREKIQALLAWFGSGFSTLVRFRLYKSQRRLGFYSKSSGATLLFFSSTNKKVHGWGRLVAFF